MKIELIIQKYLLNIKLRKTNATYLFEKWNFHTFEIFIYEKEITDSNDINDVLIYDYIEFLQNRKCSSATINYRIACLKRAFRFCKVENDALMDFENLKRDIKHYSFLDEKKVKKLFTYLDSLNEFDKFDCLKKLIIQMLLVTGVRKSELLDFKIKNVNLEKKRILLEHTKAHRERYVFFDDKTKLILKRYYKFISKDNVYLFWNFNTNKKLNDRNLRTLYESIRSEAGVYFSPHVLRHTNATMLCDDGMILNHLKSELGHASLKTTEIYLHNSVKKLQNSFNKHAKVFDRY